MFCSLSGEPPETPVVSKKSGNLYEKRVISKYIAENGKEPGTEDDLSEEDLLEIKVVPKSVKPRLPNVTSIPALLSTLQNEWDSVMLETYTLKEKYTQVRQELSHSLYQYDAACHVIARLTKERDAAREALENVQAHISVQKEAEPTDMEIEEPTNSLPADVASKIDATLAELSKTRRKRKAPEDLATPEQISAYATTQTISSLHSASTPGITTMDFDATQRLIVTGGADKHAQIQKVEDEKVVATLKGHTKKINKVLWHTKENEAGRMVFSASADKTVRIWQASESGKYSAAHILKGAKGEITGLDVHPCGEYLATASLDSTWSLYDIDTGKSITSASKAEDNGYTCSALHPDGLIYATGTSADVVQIWDLKSRSNVASFPGHAGAITSVTFSENGYLLATASADESCVRLWDLRKLKNVQTLSLDNSTGPVRALDFDYSGTYLAAAGMDLRVWKVKGWSELLSRDDHTADITQVRFGTNAKEIVTASMDRSVLFYGSKE